MYKKLFALCLILALLLPQIPVSAVPHQGDGRNDWSDDVDPATVITLPVPGGYLYFGRYRDTPDSTQTFLLRADSTVTEAQIPQTVEGSTVVGIEDHAFLDCALLGYVHIPRTVQWVFSSSFTGCRHLTRIDVASGNPYYHSIDGVLYHTNHDDWTDTDYVTLEAYPPARKADHLFVPEGVDMITRWAFSESTALTSVSLPTSLTAIQPAAFGDHTTSTSIEKIFYAGTSDRWAAMSGTDQIPSHLSIYTDIYTPDQTVPTTYDDILSLFYTGLTEDWPGPFPSDLVSDLYQVGYTDFSLSDIGHTFLDLDGNGQDELLITPLDLAQSGEVYDLYTISQGKLIHVFSGGERYHYQICQDGSIIHDSSGGAMLSVQEHSRLNASGTLTLLQALVYDGNYDQNSPWSYTTKDYQDPITHEIDHSLLAPISQEEATALQDSFPDPLSLELIPLEDYDPRRSDPLHQIRSLLSGVHYHSTQQDVSHWSDEDLCAALYSKLMDGLFRSGDASYLHQLGIGTDPDDMCRAKYTAIQQLSLDSFGRHLPQDLSGSPFHTDGDDLVFSPAIGESEELSVQAIHQQGDLVTAVGTAVHHYNAESEFLGYFQATLKVSPSSVYGYTLLSLDPTAGGPVSTSLIATASTELEEAHKIHHAHHVLDGDRTTVWCEGASGVGIGEWIMLQTADGAPLDLNAVSFSLGHQRSAQHQSDNGWPTEVLIQCDGGYAQTVSFYGMDDCILLDRPVSTSWIRFTILDAQPGARYEDTCITEIRLHGVSLEPGPQEHLHDFTGNWRSDATSHYHQCPCGETDHPLPHTYGQGVVTQDGTTYTCIDCGYLRTQQAPTPPKPTDPSAPTTTPDTAPTHTTHTVAPSEDTPASPNTTAIVVVAVIALTIIAAATVVIVLILKKR